MFSQTVEYALRAVVFLAQNRGSAATDQVAAATKVPPAYLAKVMQGLVRGGIVVSRRGVGGGVALARKPEELTVLEVVNAVDPIVRIRTCPLELSTHGANLCPLHRRLDNALAMVEDAFRATTLAEVLSAPGESVPLCDFPPVQPLTKRKR
jgi:Rrf2 family transcriptional regulator, nitric oxide-sensitive transcriptional repressor